MGGSAVRVGPADTAGEVPVSSLPGAVPVGPIARLAAAPAVQRSSGLPEDRRPAVQRPAGPPEDRPARRAPARRVGPEPAGPGRQFRRAARPSALATVSCRPARRVPAVRASAARPVSVHPAPARVVAARGRAGRERPAGLAALAQFALVAVVAAIVVGGLGMLADGVREARVPEATGLVQVHAGESIWQVARRAAPSADPGAVGTDRGTEPSRFTVGARR